MSKLKQKIKELDWWKIITNFIKTKAWYTILVIGFSIYVLENRFAIYYLSEMTAKNVIFFVWIALLIFPLFSEIEIGSFKLKKEFEQARAEMNKAVGDLRNQIIQMNISNQYILSPLIPLEEFEKTIKRALSKKEIPDYSSKEIPGKDVIDDHTVFLFKVRLFIEQKIKSLCNNYQFSNHYSLVQMLRILVKQDVIDRNMGAMIEQTIKIANRAVHGETVSNEYVELVKNAYPTIIYALENAEKKFCAMQYISCPRCHYSGTTLYWNECPQCGFVTDEY